jgi:hypothetical protein
MGLQCHVQSRESANELFSFVINIEARKWAGERRFRVQKSLAGGQISGTVEISQS